MRGHALSMQAIPGGKATHDTIDSPKMAALRRGGRLPQASVSPATRRATRARLRRRGPRARTRAELLAHVQQTNRPYHLPALGHKMASTANREGVAARCADPAGHKRLAVDVARSRNDDARLREVARTLLSTATPHDAHTLYLRHALPGIGTIFSRVWRDEIQLSPVFPRAQAGVSSGRLGTCAQASAGKRWGTSGTKNGEAHLTWACSAAAVVCLRGHPPAPPYLARLEHTPDTGPALPVLAHQVARAVSARRTRRVAFAEAPCVPRSWRGADAPGAHGPTLHVAPDLGLGRYEGTETVRGRRNQA